MRPSTTLVQPGPRLLTASQAALEAHTREVLARAFPGLEVRLNRTQWAGALGVECSWLDGPRRSELHAATREIAVTCSTPWGETLSSRLVEGRRALSLRGAIAVMLGGAQQIEAALRLDVQQRSEALAELEVAASWEEAGAVLEVASALYPKRWGALRNQEVGRTPLVARRWLVEEGFELARAAVAA